jgi:hypothetical protein
MLTGLQSKSDAGRRLGAAAPREEGRQGGDVADVEIFDHNSPQHERHCCERSGQEFGLDGKSTDSVALAV